MGRNSRLSDVAAIQAMPLRGSDNGEHFSMSIRPIEGGHIVHTSRSKGDSYEHREYFSAERPKMPECDDGPCAGDESLRGAVEYLNRK